MSYHRSLYNSGTAERTRTPNPLIRSQMRYPVAPPVLPYGTDIMSLSINMLNTVLNFPKPKPLESSHIGYQGQLTEPGLFAAKNSIVEWYHY